MVLQTGSRKFATAAALCASVALSAASALAAGEPTPQAIGYQPLTAPNACLPDADGFRSAYAVYASRHSLAAWSRLLVVYQSGQDAVRAHAYCVFTLEGRLWSYDEVGGSRRVWIDPADKNDAEKLGRILCAPGFVRAAWADRTL